MQIDGPNINVAITLALQNFITCFFGGGELVSFTSFQEATVLDDEITVRLSFIAEFSQKGRLEFRCKLFMMRNNGMWYMHRFMEIGHLNFREGMAVDLTLPTALERGREFKKAMGF